MFCKSCYPATNQTQLSNGTDTSSIKGDSKDSCPRCGGKVFEAEKLRTRSHVFHKKCFNCHQCKHPLSYNSMFSDKDGEIFCKTCYLKIYFTNSKNHYLDSNKGGVVDEADPEACVQCKTKVYQAERVCTRGGYYHTSCLSCKQCHKSLDNSSYLDGPGQGVFCRSCYAQLYGHRSRSRSRGPVDVTQFPADEDDPNKCQGCKGKMFGPEKLSTCFGSFHSPCFKCEKCNKSLLLSPESACSRNGTILCKQCFTKEKSVSRKEGNDEDGTLLYARSIADSHIIPAEDGDPDKCPRCSGKGKFINLFFTL